jgi:hypothetical protein
MELERTGRYDLLYIVYIKKRKVVGKTTVGIKTPASRLSREDQ